MCKKVLAQSEIPQDVLKLNGRAGYPKKDKLPLKVRCLHKTITLEQQQTCTKQSHTQPHN